ncbi:MAG: alpha-mannosidase [Chloroflexota bacterium]
MPSTVDQRLVRLRSRIDEMRSWVDRASLILEGWRCNGLPIEVGDHWPQLDGVTLFERSDVGIPGAWPLEETRLELDLGGEALVRLLYRDGSEEGFGSDPQHRRFPVRDRRFSIAAQAVARLPFGAPARNTRLVRARLVLEDPDLQRLIRFLQRMHETVRAVRPSEVIDYLLTAAEQAVTGLDWPSATAEYVSRVAGEPQMQAIWQLPRDLSSQPAGLSDERRASVRLAADRLQSVLQNLQKEFPGHGSIGLSAHAHLDLAWLWPLVETRRKAQRTFHTVVDLLKRYQEMRFNQSSAQLYAYLQEDNPPLFNEIKAQVAAGSWEPVGGMWVEPDANMPCGESLCRQLLYGQRFFRATFGNVHTVCWMPDCFGFTPALPQILRLGGIERFFTIKLTWSETNTFPYDLFWWEGIDGSRVLAHTFDNPDGVIPDTGGYNGEPGPWALTRTWNNFRGKSAFGESLLTIGFGDGGGGPTAEMLETHRAIQIFPALPASHFTRIDDFFDRLQEAVQGRDLPVWNGELYLELHRGTLTTQSRTKYLHRRAERDLIAAEVVSCLAHLTGGPEPESLESLWHVVLRNEFHDILPGSGIREVYEEAEAELSAVVDSAGHVIERSLAALAEQIVPHGDAPVLVVVNPDLSARPLRVELDHIVPGAQRIEGGSVLATGDSVPGLTAGAFATLSARSGLRVSSRHLENQYISAQVDEQGTLTSVYHKGSQREALSGPGNQIWAYVDKPREWDAWELDEGYREAGHQLVATESIRVVEDGPHRVALRITRHFRESVIIQDLRLWSNSPRLDFKTFIDWHDRRWLLKARFPLAVMANRASFETAFGIIERPTHQNTTWELARFEVAGHRFVDLSEPGFGVALLNDGKYGHHVFANELGISLLRSPVYPDPLAGEGPQTFTYALLPHSGAWLQGGVLMEAEDLNRPLLARATTGGLPAEVKVSPVRIAGPQLGLGSLKVAEDGGSLVLRTYEPQGARGVAALALPDGWQADAGLDVLERDLGQPDFHFDPFQIRSWRLRRRP